jgi:hypothetical protein
MIRHNSMIGCGATRKKTTGADKDMFSRFAGKLTSYTCDLVLCFASPRASVLQCLTAFSKDFE